jgi:hypothetical protein
MNFIFEIRNLWLQLALWMRSFILSAAMDSGDLTAVSARLYEVPLDFYTTLRVVFGRPLAESFKTLLTRYIVTAAMVFDAMKRHDQDAVNKGTEQWYLIADEMAQFLAQNPAWEESQWRAYLYQNISMNVSQMLAALQAEYEKGIAIYERINARSVVMADYMSGGIPV